jgi:hypothetical protein
LADDKSRDDLNVTRVDYVTVAAKAALGAVPFAGSLLAELAGTVIPNQRIDRIVRFASQLETRLANVERDAMRSNLADENFTDLMEEGLRQAARSTTDERRAHIASVIANSLTSERISFVESKHLLRLLGEINDIEVVWLRFYLHPEMSGDQEFRSKHEDILTPVAAHLQSSQAEIDKEILQNSYKAHLCQLGLLRERYQMDPKTQLPAFDKMRGELKVSGYDLSRTGHLLLKLMGLEDQK